jgi:3-oxoacyl-[acyl-carrier protein] reductase
VKKRALVFGGSGAVGSEVVRGLAAREIATVFTYYQSKDRAESLAAQTGATALRCDLRDPDAVRELIRSLTRADSVTHFVHCAAVTRAATLSQLTIEDWEAAQSINARSAFIACQELLPRFTDSGGGEVVLVGALDRGQSLPLPVHFAASQGMLASMAMALSKELGRAGARVNVVALGPLETGLSKGLPEKLMADYKAFSAFRRVGTATEAARAVLWLLLENKYIDGRTIAVNGGI